MNRDHQPAPVDLSTESVAGEEDPGASLDLPPANDVPSATPGTGENVCPKCGGSGKVVGITCTECQGSGKVTRGIGGA
jgi:hypothetical protein